MFSKKTGCKKCGREGGGTHSACSCEGDPHILKILWKMSRLRINSMWVLLAGHDNRA
jgi:hypothetical protein